MSVGLRAMHAFNTVCCDTKLISIEHVLNMPVELLSEVQGMCFSSPESASSASYCVLAFVLISFAVTVHSSVKTRLLDLQEHHIGVNTSSVS